MNLAPLTSTLNAMLVRLPFTVTEELDPSAVHQQVQGAIGAPIRIWTANVLYRRHKVV